MCAKGTCECWKRGYCEKSCNCNPEICIMRRPGCKCEKGDCKSKNCECYRGLYECEPGVDNFQFLILVLLLIFLSTLLNVLSV